MTVLGLVIAAGLVMGLIAFRMTAGNAPVATAAVGATATGGNPSAAQSSDTGAEWGVSESSSLSSTDAQPGDRPEARDGASPEIATPEPAPPPPPPPPPPAETVVGTGDTPS